MIIITESGEKFKILACREIKKDELYLNADLEISIAEDDFPDDFSSFILEKIED